MKKKNDAREAIMLAELARVAADGDEESEFAAFCGFSRKAADRVAGEVEGYGLPWLLIISIILKLVFFAIWWCSRKKSFRDRVRSGKFSWLQLALFERRVKAVYASIADRQPLKPEIQAIIDAMKREGASLDDEAYNKVLSQGKLAISRVPALGGDSDPPEKSKEE